MEKFIEKLSTYNILNNILPGVVFSYLCNRLLGIQLVDNSIVENLFFQDVKANAKGYEQLAVMGLRRMKRLP